MRDNSTILLLISAKDEIVGLAPSPEWVKAAGGD